jgi:hypothetical protein
VLAERSITGEPPTTEGELRVRKLALAATAAALTLAALPSAATATDVCNEAENSWKGDYDMTATSDPNPPAFLRGTQMVLAKNGKGKGLVHAAERSPSKEVCTFGGGGGGGGEDPPPSDV